MKRRRHAVDSTMRSFLFAFVLLVITPQALAQTLFGTVRVIDGDSLMMGSTEIRLESIDAPEWDQVCHRGEPLRRYRCGLQAKDALIGLIAGRPVDCEGVVQPNGTVRDTYGRFLGLCRNAAGVVINGWMVLRGHALAFRRYSLEYVPQEDEARDARRGMWAGPSMAPWDWRLARKAGP